MANSSENFLRSMGVTDAYGTPEYWKQYDSYAGRADMASTNQDTGQASMQFGPKWEADPDRFNGMNAYLGDPNQVDYTRNTLLNAGMPEWALDMGKQQVAAKNNWTPEQTTSALRSQELFGNDMLGTSLNGTLLNNPGGKAGGSNSPMGIPSLDMNNGGRDTLANWMQTGGAGATLDGLQAFTGSYNPWAVAGSQGSYQAGTDNAGNKSAVNLRPLLQTAAQTGFDVSKYNLNAGDQNNQIQQLYDDMNKALAGYHNVHTLSSNYGDNSRGERGNANILYQDDGSGVWNPLYVGKQGEEARQGNYFQQNPDLMGTLSVLMMGAGGVGGLANMAGAGLTGGALTAANLAGSVAMGAAGGGEKGALAGLIGGIAPMGNGFLSNMGVNPALAQGITGAVGGGLKNAINGGNAATGALMGGVGGLASGMGKELGANPALSGLASQLASQAVGGYMNNREQGQQQEAQQQAVQSIYQDAAQRGISKQQIDQFLQTPQGRAALQAIIPKSGGLSSLFG